MSSDRSVQRVQPGESNGPEKWVAGGQAGEGWLACELGAA